jgi:hypothetical protein
MTNILKSQGLEKNAGEKRGDKGMKGIKELCVLTKDCILVLCQKYVMAFKQDFTFYTLKEVLYKPVGPLDA